MRAGIGLQEIEWSDSCREGVTERGEISDCQGVKSGHTEVGNAVLTHHRQGLAGKSMTGAQVLRFYCLFPW